MKVEIEVANIRNALEALCLHRLSLSAAMSSGRIGPVRDSDYDAIQNLIDELKPHGTPEDVSVGRISSAGLVHHD